MKVKTLLKTLVNTEYVITTRSGSQLERDIIQGRYLGDSEYEDETIETVRTVAGSDILFIRLK